VGFGSAIGVVVFVLVMLVALAYLRLIDAEERAA
jgi:ABC-type sugar transport system permease subunit